MKPEISPVTDVEERRRLTRRMLEGLKSWFGIAESRKAYVEEAAFLCFFRADLSGDFAGLLTIKQHNEHSAEIHLMGVPLEHQRKGVGRALLKKAERELSAEGVKLLQVKTLCSSHPSRHYGETRAFYRAMGFYPLETFKTLWDEHNPCLILIKPL